MFAQQLSIFDAPPPADRPGPDPKVLVQQVNRLHRRTDPDTSRAAAQHVAPRLGELQARALRWVRERPGLTATELARAAGEGDPRVFNRRLGELEGLGRVVRGPARRCTATGRQAAVWAAAEGGE